MAVTTSILRNAGSIADAVGGAVKAVHDVHGKVRKSRDAFRDGVLDPLTEGLGWSGQGYDEARTVLGSNEAALTTTLFRLEQAASAYGGLHDALRSAAGWWEEMQISLDPATYDVAEDGTVTVRPGVRPGSDQPSAERLTGQLEKILGYLDARDRSCAVALHRLATAELPVVSSRATPGLEERAQQALHAALGDTPHPTVSWDPDWTLLASFGSMPFADWVQAIGGYPGCDDMSGGGYVTGPDGRRYPIAVPVMTDEEGSAYTHGDGVDTRGGLDTGWQTLGVVTGPVNVGEPTPGLTKGLILLGAVAGAPYPDSRYAPDLTDGLEFDRDGFPTRSHGAHYDTGYTLPPDADDGSDTNLGNNAVGGLQQVDVALQNLDAANHVDDRLHYTYRAEFQQNVDGRTRVQLTAYQVTMDGDDDTPTVHPYDVYVDSEGRMQLTPARWYAHGESARSGDGIAVANGRPDG